MGLSFDRRREAMYILPSFSRVERLSCIVHTYKSWGWITVMITYQFVGKEVCIVHTYIHTYIICMYMHVQ